MKKIISIIIVAVIAGLIAWGAWHFIFSKNSGHATTPNPSGLLPSAPSTVPAKVQSQTQSGETVFVQGVASAQNQEVAKDFLSEIQNSNQIALGGTVVASPYALQIWGDANKGGEALLEYTSSTWTLISLGGGEWTVLALLQENVPLATAQQLVAGLTNESSLSSATSSVVTPPGETLTIGTSHGNVTMNNFYNSAEYIDDEQGTVLIQQSSTYSIIYTTAESSFSLVISGTPSDPARRAAEAGFLDSLGISQQEACTLSVYESFPRDVPIAYQQQGLTFCTSNSAFQSQ